MQKVFELLKPDYNGRFEIHPWTTHLPILIKTLDRGRPLKILELGSGDCSTVILHEYVSGKPHAELVTVENDQKWFEGLLWMRSPQHVMQYVPNWDYTRYDMRWDLVFIDHGPESERQPALGFFTKHSQYVILHDSQYPERYSKYWPAFECIVHDKRYSMNTTLFAHMDVSGWFPEAARGFA